MLAPYGGPVPAGYTVHETESPAWRAEAAIPPPRARGPQLALNPAVGRALAGLPADLVLVTSYTEGELEPLLPALGWDTVPPLVPLRNSGATYYLRPDDRVLSPHADIYLRSRAEEIALWARTHDRPVAWVRAGGHHTRLVNSRFGLVPHRGAAAAVRGRPGHRAHRGRPPGPAAVAGGDGRAAGTGPRGAPAVPGLRGPGHHRARRPPHRPRPPRLRLLLRVLLPRPHRQRALPAVRGPDAPAVPRLPMLHRMRGMPLRVETSDPRPPTPQLTPSFLRPQRPDPWRARSTGGHG